MGAGTVDGQDLDVATPLGSPPAGAARTEISPVAPAGRAPLPWLAVLGLGVAGAVAACGVVVGVGAVGPVRGTELHTTWLGLIRAGSPRAWAGGLVLASVASMVLVWALLLVAVHRDQVSSRRVWTLAASWATPLAVGPPMLSNDVFSYAAHGVLQLSEFDPYRTPPAALGHSPALLAVDPRWRHVRSPYGPVATWLEHAAAWTGRGNLLATVLLLRVLAVACVVAIGLVAARLVPEKYAAMALALTVADPLLLLHGISAVHLEAYMGALLLGALLAVQRDRPALGVALACLAGAIKVPAMLAAVAILAVVARSPVDRVRRLTRCVAAGAVVWLGLTLLVPDAWGWLRALGTPIRNRTRGVPTELVASAMGPVLRGWVSPATLQTAARVAGALVAAGIVGYLLATAQRRDAARTVGLGLIAVAALAPVVYPWYLLWGGLCLAVVPEPRIGRRLALLAAGACFVDLPGQDTAGGVVGTVLAATLLVAAGAPDRLLDLPRRVRRPASRDVTPALR